jgi:flagellin
MGFQQGFRINTNTASLNTYRSYGSAQAGLEKNIERLSSGLRINKAADDAAGLAISNRMDNQVRGMQQANRNVQQGNNMLQTAEGAMEEISNILSRMRELSVQSASDGVNTDDRASIDLEFQQLKSEITRIAEATEYNNTKVLNGNLYGNVVDAASGDLDEVTNVGAEGIKINQNKNTAAGTYTLKFYDKDNTATELTADGLEAGDVVRLSNGSDSYDYVLTSADMDTTATTKIKAGSTLSFGNSGIEVTTKTSTLDVTDLQDKTIEVNTGDGATLQVGADNSSDQRIGFSLKGQTSTHLNLEDDDLISLANAQTAIDALDDAIQQINDERATIGSKQNRLEFTSSNLMNSIQNNSASMSTIRDADFASEAADMARNQILVQSGTSMLAQANGLSQNVLALIR